MLVVIACGLRDDMIYWRSCKKQLSRLDTSNFDAYHLLLVSLSKVSFTQLVYIFLFPISAYVYICTEQLNSFSKRLCQTRSIPFTLTNFSVFLSTIQLVQTRSSGGSTTCVCDLRSMVPIFDLIAGVLSKSSSFILHGNR